MQGGYELIAEISRRILELNDEGKLAGILLFDDEGKTVQPLIHGYARRTCGMLNERFETDYGTSSVTSAIKKVVPGIKGMRFVPYQPSTELTMVSPDLEARVAALEAQVRELLDALT